MEDFEFPTNIKQIGSIGDGVRIYMEDYVYSYLQQYADTMGYEERIAYLVGRTMVIDGQTVLFISGAIQGLHVLAEKDRLTFTEKSWQYAKEQMKQYFKGLEVVGWMQAQPGYGIRLGSSHANYHAQHFRGRNQVLFVMDPIEKMNTFYAWDEEAEQIEETRGYFIYYDKNRGMHEYMLDNKVTKVEAQSEVHVEDEEVQIELEPIKKVREPEHRTEYRPRHKPQVVLTTQQTAARRGRKPASEQRKTTNMLVSLSAVLLLVCFIMGAGLIQNDGKISLLEDQMTSLNTAYRDLLLELEQEKDATSVFAAQEEPPAEQAQLITEDGNQALEENLVAQVQSPTQAPTAKPTPEPTAEPTPEPTVLDPVSSEEIPETYTVQEGDSLIYISEKFYGNRGMVDEIMQANNMDDPNMIYFGKVLKLPKE